MSIILSDDISRLIWKSFFSIHILPSIINKFESDTPSYSNIYLPLEFWFNSNPGLAIPLYHSTLFITPQIITLKF